MVRKLVSMLAGAALLALAGTTGYANLLLNPGFESGLSSWTQFGSGTATEAWAARSGSLGLAFYGWDAGGGGVYQDVSAGGVSNYTFTVYAFQDANWPSRTVEVKLEFFDSGFTLLASTSKVVTSGTSWQQLSIAGQSAAGTAYVRPVMAFGAGSTGGGAFKWDDSDLTSSPLAIPEPAAVSLIGLGVLVLHRAWRRVR